VELAGEDGGSVASVADDAGVVAGALVVEALVVGAAEDGACDGVGVAGVSVGLVGGGGGGVLDGGGVVVGSCTCWHCQTTGELVTVPPMPPRLPTVAARLCGAASTLAAKPAVAVRRVPPVMRPIATGRTRAKHM